MFDAHYPSTRLPPYIIRRLLRGAMMLPLLSMIGGLLTDSSFAGNLEETLTVTASRLPMDSARSGNPIEIITRDDIEALNPVSLAELLRSRAGLSISQQSGVGGLTQVRMRGSEANHVLVLIDGIEANDIGQGSEFNFSQFPIQLIEKIEIVHGAESALWGSDAVAGVIHIITRPENFTAGTAIALEAGSFGSESASLRSSVKLGETALGIGLSHFKTDGFNVSRHGTEADGSNQQAWFVNAERSLGEDWRLKGQLSLQRSDNDFDAVDYVSTGLPIDAVFRSEHDRLQTGITVHKDNGSRDHRINASFSRDKNLNRTYPGADTTTDGKKSKVSYQISQQLGQHLWAGFAEFENTQFRQGGPASVFGDPNQNRSVRQQSLGTEYRFEADQWTHSLSLRVDRNSDYDSALSLKGNAVYWATDQIRFFGSLGKSVKNPTFTERFGYFTNFVGNPDLRPESSLTLDTGIQYLWPDQTADFTLHIFTARLKDEINGFSFDPNALAYTAVNQSDTSRQRGAELKLNWMLTDSIVFDFGLSHLKAETGSGITEIRRPTTSARLGLAYTQGDWQWRLAGAYTGSMLDTFYPPRPPYAETLRLGAFSLWSVSGNWTVLPNLSTFMVVDNITDRSYEEVVGYQRAGLSSRLGIKWRIK